MSESALDRVLNARRAASGQTTAATNRADIIRSLANNYNATAQEREENRRRIAEANANSQQLLQAQRERDKGLIQNELAGDYAKQTVTNALGYSDLARGKLTTGISPQENANAIASTMRNQSLEDSVNQIMGNVVTTDEKKRQQLADTFAGTVGTTPELPSAYSYNGIMNYGREANRQDAQINSMLYNAERSKELQRQREEARQKATPEYQAEQEKLEKEAQNRIDLAQSRLTALQKTKERLQGQMRTYRGVTAENANGRLSPQELQAQIKAIDDQIAAETMDFTAEQEKLNQQIYNRKMQPYIALMGNSDFAVNSMYRNTDDATVNRVNGMKPKEYDPLTAMSEDYLDTIRKDERQVYNYILNTQGKDAANKFLDLLKPELDKRATVAAQQRAQSFGESDSKLKEVGKDILGTAESILMSPLRGAGTIGAIVDKAVNGTVNPYAFYNRPANVISAQRSGMDERSRQNVSNLVAALGGDENAQKAISGATSLINNAVISGLESAWNAFLGKAVVGSFGMSFSEAGQLKSMIEAIPEAQRTAEAVDALNKAQKVIDAATQFTTVIMGAGAVPEAIRNAKDRGLSDNQAFIEGLISGVIEYATEHVTVENLFNTDWTPKNVKQILMKGLQQANFEGLEEVNGEILNTIADRLVAQGKSEWQKSIDGYMAEGDDEQTAFNKTLLGKVGEIAKSYLSGAISTAGTVGGEVFQAGAYQQATNGVHNAVEKADTKNGTRIGAQIEEIIRSAAGTDESTWNDQLANMVNAMGEVYKGNAVNRARDYLREASQTATDTETALVYADMAKHINDNRKAITDLAKSKKSGANIEVETEGQPTAQETVTPTTETQNAAPANTEAPAVLTAPKLTAAQPPQTVQNAVPAQIEAQTNENTAVANTAQNASTETRDTRNGRNIFLDNMNLNEESTDADAAKSAYDQVRNNRGFGTLKRGLIQSVVQKQVETLNDMRDSGLYTPEQIQQATDTAKAIDAQLRQYVNPENTQKRINALNSAMKRAGVKADIVVDPGVGADYETGVTGRGSYREEDGTIHINPYMDTQEAFYGVIAHEVFHKAADGSVRNELVDDVLNARKYILDNYKTENNNGITRASRSLIANNSIGDYVASYSDLLKNRFGLTDEGRAVIQNRMAANPGLSEAEAMQQLCDENEDAFWSMFGTDKSGGTARDYMREEVAAHFMETLGSQQGDEILRTLLRDNRTALQKFIDAVRKLLNLPDRDIGDRQVYENLVNSYERLIAEESGLEEKTLKGTPNEKTTDREATVSAVADDGTVLTGELEGGTETKYSLKSWNDTDIRKVRKSLLEAGFTIKEINKWIGDVNSIAAIIANDKERLDYIAAEHQKFMKPNGDYKYTLDASTLCAKRLIYQGTFNKIAHKLGNAVLTPNDLIDLMNMMEEDGYQTPCGICYVESRRRHLSTYSQEWLDGYKGDYIPTLDEVVTTDGLEKLRKDHPQTYTDFVSAMNKIGTNNPKVVQLRTDYRGDVQNMRKDTVEALKRIGGLRIQSFSDFETPHLIDMMQAVLDMSAKHLTGQAYTKVPNFAWVFGATGIKINLSLIGDIDANGNLTFSSTEGMNFDEAMKLRDRYSYNVGTILVGKNNAHILAAMADPRIDFIIPFHKSGWSNEEIRNMKTLQGFDDYTDYQSERFITGKDENENYTTINLNDAGENAIYPEDYWDYSLSGRENAERYLNLCKEKGFVPKFSNFLVDNHDGSFSLQPDGSTDGYWKTLIDFKMYDNEGKGAPQQEVVPNINMKEAQRVLHDYTGGANELPSASDEFIDKYVDYYQNKHSNEPETPAPKKKKGKKSANTSRQSREITSEQDEEYLKAVESGDMDKAQRMVDEAARNAGYTIKVYHGTPQETISASRGRVSGQDYQNLATDYEDKLFPFVVFKGDGRLTGIYTATDKGIAKTFSYNFSDTGTVYDLYAKADNPFRFDAEGNGWNNISPNAVKGLGITKNGKITLDDVAKAAKEQGYDAVIVDNVRETGSGDVESPATTDVIVFNPEQVKSADPVTYDDNGEPIKLSERFNDQDDDVRFSREVTSEEDKTYMDAVDNGEIGIAGRMVQNAALEWGAVADDKGQPLDLYHGTGRFGFTVFDTQQQTDSQGMIYATTKREVAANYAGRDHYASTRPIGKPYVPNATAIDDIITNAQSVLESDYSRITPEQVSEIRENAESAMMELSEKYDNIIQKAGNKLQFLYDEDTDREFETAEDHVNNLFWTIASAQDWDNNDEYVNYLEGVLRNYEEDLEKVRTYLRLYRKEIIDAVGRDFFDFYNGFELFDQYVDMEYKYLPVIRGGDVLINKAGNVDTAEQLQERMDAIHRIGSYHLYGNVGDNPYILDANGGSWVGLHSEELLGDAEKWASTDTIARKAKERGYTAVIIKNVYDGGNMADDYIFFDPNQVKSADPVTYDNNGNPIPLSERFNSENEDIRYSREMGDDYEAYNHTALLKEDTVDRYLKDYAAEKSPNYAQAYITRISPQQFLSLTSTTSGENIVRNQTEPMRGEELADAARQQPIQIRIEDGEVVGHEGRHRMVAMERNGINSVPVLVFDSSNKNNKTDLPELTLQSQEFGSGRRPGTTTLQNLIPLNYANRDRIVFEYGTQPTLERMQEKYNGKQTMRFSRELYNDMYTGEYLGYDRSELGAKLWEQIDGLDEAWDLHETELDESTNATLKDIRNSLDEMAQANNQSELWRAYTHFKRYYGFIADDYLHDDLRADVGNALDLGEIENIYNARMKQMADEDNPNNFNMRFSRELKSDSEYEQALAEEREKYDLLKAQFVAKTPWGDARAINKSAFNDIVKRYKDLFGDFVPEDDIKQYIRGLYEIAQRPKGDSKDTAEARYKEIGDYAEDVARKLLDASSYANVLKESIGDEQTLNALNALYDSLNSRRSDDQTGYYYIIPDMITAAGSKEAWDEIRKNLNGVRLQGFKTQAEADKSGRKSIGDLFGKLTSDDSAYGLLFTQNKGASDFDKISQIASQYSLARDAFRDAYETVRTENRAENEADVLRLANDLLYSWGRNATPTVMAQAENRVQEEREKGRERLQNARERGQQLVDETKQKANERLQKEKERGQKRLDEEREKAQKRADRVRENTEKREAAMEERFEASYERMRQQYERRQQKAEERYDKFVEKIRQRDIRTATRELNGQIAKRLKKLNQWLEKPQKETGKHIPQKLRPVVAKVLESILSGTGDIKLSNAKTMTAARMNQIQKEELDQTRQFVDDLVQGLNGIRAADGKNSVVTEMFLARLDEMVQELNDLRAQIKPIQTGENGTEIIMEDQVKEQNEESAEAYYEYLLTIKNMLDMTMKTLREENRMIVNGKAEDLQTVMEPLKEDLAGRKSLPIQTEHRKLFNMMGDRARNMKFSGLSGDLLFSLLGDNWHDLVMHSFREGQNRQAQHEAQFADMMKELTDGYDFTNAGYNGEFVKLKKPDVETDQPYLADSQGSKNRNDNSNTFNATRAQIMQLYALWQRPDARRHLENGGACFTNERGQDFKQNTYKVTPELFEEWTSVLTDEEKKIADGIVKFLSEEASEWGNDVSKYVYGYRIYDEDRYFPMDVADYSLKKSNTNVEREPSPLNPSFSHATTKSVKPLSLTNIFDVANDHVRKMSIYNAYAAACNDLDKIVSDQDMNQLLMEKFGNGALDAIKEFIQTTGGMKLRTAEESQALNWRALANWRMNNYKRQAVSWNLSTAMKQGISIVRAANVIDPKYLATSIVTPGTQEYKDIRDKMQSMSGVAYIKSLGYSDTGFGKTIQQLYDPNALNDSGVIRGALSASKGGRGLIRAYDKFTYTGMWLAAKADEWTWVNLWNAASKEVKDQNPNASQEELDRLTTERFNDIIGLTQVVDTALDTAPIMRSKFLQTFLPFMNEPTKSLGNLILAADQRSKPGGKKQYAKVLATTAIANMILEPIITSMFAMWRDEKDDWDKFGESFMEKMFGIKPDGSTNYKDIITSNFFGGLWQYPFIQGIYDNVSNVLQNYDNSSIDNAAIIDTAKAMMNLYDNSGKTPNERMKTQNRLWRDFIEQIAADVGIPAKTIRRQLSGTARAIMNAVGANSLKWEYNKLSYNLENSNARSQKGFYDILAKTYADGDIETYQRMMSELNEIVSGKSTLIDEKSIRQAIEKRGGEVKPGSDIWNADVQARFRLDTPVKGWKVENFVTGAYVNAQKAGIDESVADDVLLNMPDAYEYTDEDGDTVKMDPADYLQYAADVGQLSYRTLTEMSSGANAKQWASLNADQKVVAIRDVYKYVKAKYKKDYNSDYDIRHQGVWMDDLYSENATPSQIAKAALEQGAKYDKELKRSKKAG